MSVEYLDTPLNFIVIMKEKNEQVFLQDVIAIDFDDKYYRFYLAMFNPKVIGDVKTKVYKPDGQLGSLGLPYVFNKKQVREVIYNYKKGMIKFMK